MERRITKNIEIENATLIFKNFKGKKSDYNEEGNRNFGVLLDEPLARELEEDGWKVRYLKPRPDDPDQYAQPWIRVKVRFDNFPPKVVLIRHNGKRQLHEDTIDQLDWTRMENCDLIIRPYNYPAMPGRPAGVTAYLKEIYVTAVENDFEKKYAGIPDLDEAEEDE